MDQDSKTRDDQENWSGTWPYEWNVEALDDYGPSNEDSTSAPSFPGNYGAFSAAGDFVAFPYQDISQYSHSRTPQPYQNSQTPNEPSFEPESGRVTSSLFGIDNLLRQYPDEAAEQDDHTTTQLAEHIGEVQEEVQDKVDRGEIEDVEVEWSGELNSVRDAYIFLETLSEPLQIPVVENDDATDISMNRMATLGAAILKAIAHRPAPPSKGMNKVQEFHYHRQQQHSMTKIRKSLSTDQGRKTAESRALILLETAVNCHLVGLPKKDFSLAPPPKQGYKSLTHLTCGERVSLITLRIQQNKLIAWDVISGSGFETLTRNPTHYFERKIANVKSNGNKKEAQEAYTTAHAPEVDESRASSEKLTTKSKSKGKGDQGKGVGKRKRGSESIPIKQVKKRSALEMDRGDIGSPGSQRSVRRKLNDRAVDGEDTVGAITNDGMHRPSSGFGTAVLEDEPIHQQQQTWYPNGDDHGGQFDDAYDLYEAEQLWALGQADDPVGDQLDFAKSRR